MIAETFPIRLRRPKIRPPIKYFGGKTYLASIIIDLMPPHSRFVDCTVGGGSVPINHPGGAEVIVSDVEPNLMAMWQGLAHNRELPRVLGAIGYTEENFRQACKLLDETPRISSLFAEEVAAFIVRSRFSRGGIGKTFAWSERTRGGKPGDVNAWDTFRSDVLPQAIEKARGFAGIYCEDVFVTTSVFDDPETLFYVDPPYRRKARTAKSVYRREVARDDLQDVHWHARLLDRLNSLEGMVILSGYHTDLYDHALEDWVLVEVAIKNHSGQGATKQDRVECLWLNPRAAEKLEKPLDSM